MEIISVETINAQTAMKICESVIKGHFKTFKQLVRITSDSYAKKCYHMLMVLNNRHLTRMPRGLARYVFAIEKTLDTHYICYYNYLLYLDIIFEIYMNNGNSKIINKSIYNRLVNNL